MAEAIRAGSWDPVGPEGEPLIPVPTPEGKAPDLSSVYALTKFDQEQMTLMLTAAYGSKGWRFVSSILMGRARHSRTPIPACSPSSRGVS